MPAPTFTYTMKNLDRSLWQRVKAKAALEGLTVKSLIERLLIECLRRVPPMGIYKIGELLDLLHAEAYKCRELAKQATTRDSVADKLLIHAEMFEAIADIIWSPDRPSAQ